MTADDDNACEWCEIEPHEIVLVGLDGSSIALGADGVLATSKTRSAIAMAFTVSIALNHHQQLQHRVVGGFYGDLAKCRSDLLAVRHGFTTPAAFEMERLRFSVRHHQRGVRTGIVVEGDCSTILGQDGPWPRKDRAIGDWLLGEHDDQAYDIRFAFLTSQVDPPYIDNAIAGIDELLTYLECEGFQL